MNNTTGEEATALSIALRVSSDRRRICAGVRIREVRRAEGRGRVVRLAARNACSC